MTADEDTEPLVVAPAEAAPAGRRTRAGEPDSSEVRLTKRWHTRTYEFATVESAVLYLAVVAALAVPGGAWPTVEHRTRVRVHAGPPASEPRDSPVSAWAGWARRLGGSEVVGESERNQQGSTEREEKS